MSIIVTNAIIEACEAYGVGPARLLYATQATPRAYAARLALREGASYPSLQAIFECSEDTVRKLANRKIEALPIWDRTQNSVIWDVIDRKGGEWQGPGYFTGRYKADVVLALADNGLSAVSAIQHRTMMDEWDISDILEKHGAVVSEDREKFRFDKHSFIRVYHQPVWLVGKYPGYTTHVIPLGEPPSIEREAWYVWMERSRYLVPRQSLSRRFVRTYGDHARHVGFEDSWQ